MPEPTADLLWRTLDDGAVVISPEEGDVRVFNETGAIIWNLIDGQRTVGEIAERLGDEFGISIEQAEADVSGFIASLQRRQLINLKEGN